MAVDVQQYSGTGRALPLDGGDQSSSFGMVWVGSGLINLEPVRAADDAHDDGYLISGVIELQGFDPVLVPS